MSPNSRGLGTNMHVSADAVMVCFRKRISFRLCSGSLFGTKVSYGHLLGNAIAGHTIWQHISPQHGTTHYTHSMPYDTSLHVIRTLVYITWVSTCALRFPVHNMLRMFFDVYIELLISCGKRTFSEWGTWKCYHDIVVFLSSDSAAAAEKNLLFKVHVCPYIMIWAHLTQSICAV